MKRLFIAILTVGALVLAVSACGGYGKKSPVTDMATSIDKLADKALDLVEDEKSPSNEETEQLQELLGEIGSIYEKNQDYKLTSSDKKAVKKCLKNNAEKILDVLLDKVLDKVETLGDIEKIADHPERFFPGLDF